MTSKKLEAIKKRAAHYRKEAANSATPSAAYVINKMAQYIDNLVAEVTTMQASLDRAADVAYLGFLEATAYSGWLEKHRIKNAEYIRENVKFVLRTEDSIKSRCNNDSGHWGEPICDCGAIGTNSSGQITIIGKPAPIPEAKYPRITLNGVGRTMSVNEISYSDVVTLTYGSGYPHLLTIVYHNGPAEKPDGTLTPGQTVKLVDGMRFTAVFTNNA